MTRWLGIDYGTRRIGLALSDHRGSIASPAATITAAGTPSADARAILDWAAANEVAAMVVGLPLNMDGSEGAQAKLCKELANDLAGAGLPVELWDERLTSFQAEEVMATVGVKPGRRRRLRDALAAQLILQSFLDARRQKPPDSSPPPSGS